MGEDEARALLPDGRGISSSHSARVSACSLRSIDSATGSSGGRGRLVVARADEVADRGDGVAGVRPPRRRAPVLLARAPGSRSTT